MKKTALTQKHNDLDAKMVEFAGYSMPVQYSGVNDEHATVREALGIFDVSHMGEFILKGPRALDLLQKVSSNDVSKLVDGKAQYAYLPNENGGIVDDFLTYRISPEEYLVVVNASNIDKDWNWLMEHNTFDVEMENISDNCSLLAVQGPRTAEALEALTDINLSEMKYYTFKKGTFAGVENVIISATGYTGSGGFELYMENKDAEKIWDAVLEAGKEYGIKPIGLAARDTLRLEMGFCLYGNDIDDYTSPIEAGLGWVTKFTKDFINSEEIKSHKEQGVDKRLSGFIMDERGIPRHNYEIVNKEHEVIGRVTSGTMSPVIKQGIGMGYINKNYNAEGQDIYIMIRNKPVKATVAKPPFIKK